MDKHNEAKAKDFLTFFRSLDSKERDLFFEKISTEYTEIKEMEELGFKPLETAQTKEQSVSESAMSKMKQKIEAYAQKGFGRESVKQSKDKGSER